MEKGKHEVSGGVNVRARGRSAAVGMTVMAAVLALNLPRAALAEEEKQFDEMLVKSDKPAVPANVPSTTESFTARQIAESVNSVS